MGQELLYRQDSTPDGGTVTAGELNPLPVRVVAAAPLRQVGYEQITVAAALIGLSASKLAKSPTLVVITLETATVRWQAADGSPTASVGTLMNVGDVLTIDDVGDMNGIQFIRTGGTSGLLNVMYYGPGS